jgi:hypothetical protein
MGGPFGHGQNTQKRVKIEIPVTCIICENFETVVIKKPGKPDYSEPKAYRPIALLSTIGKVLESVIARQISYLIERHQLLPENDFGGRRRHSCEQAIHALLEQVYTLWRTGNTVPTLMAMDASLAKTGMSRIIV